ncbi:hypothetical protein [Goodfellowiella coeruleoviolacea]|uniref:hypothetical protein n=1 Tax=Goodfellowiella coeruleoviolacea TaxID=334858 RepID=UPI0020A3F914|nr:hypothetical protein [Goodfellowiella coeruleoviolacea]
MITTGAVCPVPRNRKSGDVECEGSRTTPQGTLKLVDEAGKRYSLFMALSLEVLYVVGSALFNPERRSFD